MFDAEKLLGGLVSTVTKQKGGFNNFGNKAAIGMGLLGVAIAAYEHFSEKNATANSANTLRQPVPPVPGATGNGRATSAPPPPPPPIRPSASVSQPPPVPANSEVNQQNSMLLIQAMVAAANADGHIDAEEREKIMGKLELIEAEKDAINYVNQLLLHPPGLETIIEKVNNIELAKQVYIVSLLVINVDTLAEQNYLEKLAQGLKLAPEQIQVIQDQLR